MHSRMASKGLAVGQRAPSLQQIGAKSTRFSSARVALIAKAEPAPEGKVNVAVLGASGGIGQPLSMLLKMQQQVGNLALYDIQNTPGVAADLSHIDSGSAVKGYVG